MITRYKFNLGPRRGESLNVETDNVTEWFFVGVWEPEHQHWLERISRLEAMEGYYQDEEIEDEWRRMARRLITSSMSTFRHVCPRCKSTYFYYDSQPDWCIECYTEKRED